MEGRKKMILKKYFIKRLFLVGLILISISPCFAGETSEDIYVSGLRSGQQGELKAAELHFKNALAVNPLYIPARRALDIINDFQQGFVDGETAVILFNGTEYYRKSEYSAAIAEFQKAVKNASGYYLAHHNLGAAYYEDGQNSKAINQYKKALKLNSRYSYTHNNLGLAYARVNRPYQAIKHYKRAIDIDPTYHKAYNNYGVALHKVEKYDEAMAMFRKAVEALIKQLQNNNAEIRFYAAEALGKPKNKNAVPALIQSLSDPHWKVKGQAVDSLRKITNLFLGDDPEEWRKWWQENQ